MEKKESQDRRWIYFTISIACILVVAVLVIIFLIQGSTTITGNGDVESVESITCEGKNINYPFFSYDNAKGKIVKVNILLNSSKKLDAINFVYNLDYATKEEAEKSRKENEASLNKSFGESHFNANSFDAHFVNSGNAMQMTLYAETREVNGMSAKYFLINGSHDFTRDNLTKNYNSQGLDCVVTNKS